MNLVFIRPFLAFVFTWVLCIAVAVEAQGSGTKWGPNVPSRLQCDEALLALYDSLREQLGVEQVLLNVLDSVKEEGAFAKGTFNSIRALTRRSDFKTNQYALLRQSVEFFLDAKNHREDLLIAIASGRLEKPLPSATYYACNARRFAMGIVGEDTGLQEFEQRTLSHIETSAPQNSPLDLILFAPYSGHSRRDLFFNWEGTSYVFDEASFDASIILHELTHYLDEKRVTRWINANLELLKAGKPADELFVNGRTVSFSDDLTQVKDATDVTVDLGLLLIYYEGRGYQVSMQTQLLSLPPETKKNLNVPQRRRPGATPNRRNPIAEQFLRALSEPKNPQLRPADAMAVREFQQQSAWIAILGEMTKKWLWHGIPGWTGPITEQNLFEVSNALAAKMDETIRRVEGH